MVAGKIKMLLSGLVSSSFSALSNGRGNKINRYLDLDCLTYILQALNCLYYCNYRMLNPDSLVKVTVTYQHA